MKHQSNNHEPHIRPKRRFVAACLIALCSAAIAGAQLWSPEEYLVGTSVQLPPDQILKLPDFADGKAFEWAAFSIQNPVKADEMIEALKSPEAKMLDGWKRLSVLDPDGYRQSWKETFGTAPWEDPKVQAEREEAHHAILNPREATTERESWMTPDERTRGEVARFAILHPSEFNQMVQRFKTKETLEQESLATLALEQPEVFTAEVKRAWEAAHAANNAANQNGGSNE